MHSNYIVRIDDELMCFYYTKSTGILCRKYNNSRWSSDEIIVKGARENFSVTLSDNKIYLFCQDSSGNILMAQFMEDEWVVKTALENKTQRAHNVLLSPVITPNSFSIIYNTLSDDRTHYLVKQQLQPNGQWSPASRIDKFIEMPDRIYSIQRLTSDHLLMFYQTRAAESNLGYREMTGTQQGEFIVFQSTSNYISDNSFLTTNTAVHVLYVVKSIFSSQLIYRKKSNSQFSNPLVLYEGQRIENCLLTISYDNIYATFHVNSQFYICMSEDKGDSFSRPAKYRKKFCHNPAKAVYITDKPQTESLLFARDLYVDRTSPWDIQLVGDMYDDFYPRPIVVEKINAKVEEPDPDNTILLNQISALQWQVDEKDKQIASLSNMVAARSDELARDTDEIKRLYKSTLQENRLLIEKLSELELKYDVLLRASKTLSEQHKMDEIEYEEVLEREEAQSADMGNEVE